MFVGLSYKQNDLCEAKHETLSVFKFGRSTPLVLPSGGQELN